MTPKRKKRPCQAHSTARGPATLVTCSARCAPSTVSPVTGKVYPHSSVFAVAAECYLMCLQGMLLLPQEPYAPRNMLNGSKGFDI